MQFWLERRERREENGTTSRFSDAPIFWNDCRCGRSLPSPSQIVSSRGAAVPAPCSPTPFQFPSSSVKGGQFIRLCEKAVVTHIDEDGSGGGPFGVALRAPPHWLLSSLLSLPRRWWPLWEGSSLFGTVTVRRHWGRGPSAQQRSDEWREEVRHNKRVLGAIRFRSVPHTVQGAQPHLGAAFPSPRLALSCPPNPPLIQCSAEIMPCFVPARPSQRLPERTDLSRSEKHEIETCDDHQQLVHFERVLKRRPRLLWTQNGPRATVSVQRQVVRGRRESHWPWENANSVDPKLAEGRREQTRLLAHGGCQHCFAITKQTRSEFTIQSN
jgi:hypothetical protein